MKDEYDIFKLLSQELASTLSIDEDEISIDSSLEDLGVDNDDLACVLAEIQDVIAPDSELVLSNAFVDCCTIQDVVDTIVDLVSEDSTLE